MVCVGVNLALNLALMGPLRHVGMALATSTAGWVNVVLMLIVLTKRQWFVASPGLYRQIGSIFAACGLMAAILIVCKPYGDHYFEQGESRRFAALAGLVLAGSMAYFLGAVGLNIMGCRTRILARFKK